VGFGFFVTLVVALVVGRLAVAGLVRTAIAQGVARARARLTACDDVAFVAGFSWGGAVVHWLLASHPQVAQQQPPQQPRAPQLFPPALILAAPVLTMSSICRLKEPPALPLPRGRGVSGDGGVAVAAVLAMDDGFCPHPATAAVYEAAGCEVIVSADDHVLQRQSSLRAIVTVVLRWMNEQRHDDDGGDDDGDGVGGIGGGAARFAPL
jgi:hypothetical protein